MEILREFLESSTIHGLAHISTSRSKRAKLAWFLGVLASFSIAIFLIWKTTKEIQDDPFSTAITTHPIGELDFPMVTICPPKGTNTAINNGLMKAKKPLTGKQKEQLKNATRKIFFEEPLVDFSNFLVAVANKENIRKMCDGSQSIPKPMSSSGQELRTNALSGSLTSPSGYAGGKTKVHYVIELPTNGSLDIQLKVEENGHVEYKEGSVFQYIPGQDQPSTKKYSFANAVIQCSNLGGQLASLHSKEELEEARRAADPNSLVQWGAWLGATFDEAQGKWEWLDGSPWDWEDWDVDQPNRTCGRECGNCLRINTTSWKLRTFLCTRTTHLICKTPPTVLKGQIQKKVGFNIEEASLFIFHLWWIPAKDVSMNDGFSMNWTISTDNADSRDVNDIYNKVLIRMVNMAREAKRMNMSKATLRSEVIKSKAKKIEDGEYRTNQCHRQRVVNKMLNGQTLDTRSWHFQQGLSIDIKESYVFDLNTTDEDLETGFELFSWLIFCPDELQLLHQFHIELLATKNVQTILQTTINNMKSGKIKEKSNVEIVKKFFSELDKIVSTDLGKIVLALSSKMDIEKALEDNMPYTKMFEDKSIRDCMRKNNSCQLLSDAIQDLGEDCFPFLK